MGKYRDTIEEGYNVYLEKYPDFQKVQTPYDYPLQEVYLSDDGPYVHIQNVLGQLEHACFVELRDDVPNVSDLPMEDLAWLPIGLTDILRVQRGPDHDALWKTTANCLPHLNSGNNLFPEQLAQNFETIVRVMLCSDWETDSSNDDDWSDEANRAHLQDRASLLARYLAFPTLEGMTKCLMKRDITIDGDVRPGQEVLSYSGDDYTEGDKVSVLGHLLWHLEQSVADNILQSRMAELRSSIKSFLKLEDESILGAYGFLSNQRNSILHGDIQAKIQFGIVLNVLCLLLLNIDHIPEERRIPP